MKAKLVTYTKGKLSGSQRSLISKNLFGYLDKSNKGKYVYERKGLLNKYKHIKVSNNTFIIELKGWPKIRDFLNKRKVKIKSWSIELTKL